MLNEDGAFCAVAEYIVIIGKFPLVDAHKICVDAFFTKLIKTILAIAVMTKVCNECRTESESVRCNGSVW